MMKIPEAGTAMYWYVPWMSSTGKAAAWRGEQDPGRHHQTNTRMAAA